MFNLSNDIGETTNLAAQKPQLVAALDALIERFLSDTKAVVPVPNPAFDPAKYDPELEGKLTNWEARNCTSVVKDGIVHITTNTSVNASLFFSALKHSGPSTITFRIKAKAGIYNLDWRIPGPIAINDQSVRFTLKGDDWQEVTVQVPARGALGIVRLYLPMQQQPVDIDWIEIRSSNGKLTRTDF